jgi:ferritin-like metal-binding protein YciE
MKLGDYVEDAHAMETNVLQMLSSMISTTDDPDNRRELEHHREETERHGSPPRAPGTLTRRSPYFRTAA